MIACVLLNISKNNSGLKVCNQVMNSGSFHLTACTLFSKVICLKHCIGWYCTGFIYGYVVRRLV